MQLYMISSGNHDGGGGGVSSCVGDVLITTGGNELLCDEILIFASKFKGGFDFADTPKESEDQKERRKSRVELMPAHGEGQDELIIYYRGIAKGKGKSANAVKQVSVLPDRFTENPTLQLLLPLEMSTNSFQWMADVL